MTADVPHRAGSTPARFGLLVQEFGRFEFTLRDTVALGSPAAAPDHQVRRALAGIFAAEFPLDTQLGQRFARLFATHHESADESSRHSLQGTGHSPQSPM